MLIRSCVESWPIQGTFTIARGAKTAAHVVVVELESDGIVGRGECVPYGRYGETTDSVVAQIAALPERELTHEALPQIMPPGAARNAVDCAFWDLRARQTGRRVWELMALKSPKPLECAYTLSLGTPDEMYVAAKTHAHAPLLKIKLGNEGDAKRVAAVRAGAPDAQLIVDANEAWTPESYTQIVPLLAAQNVSMIEQPLPADQDHALASLPRPIPVCADESCHDRSNLNELTDRYDMINIKLDKTGGLTEAVALADAALAVGLDVMVGCMVGTSLAMAPAVIVAQRARIVDLDGPLLLATDRAHGLAYRNGSVFPPEAGFWG